MRYLPALTVSAVTALLLAACGSVTSPQLPSSQQQQPSPQQQSSSAQQSSTDAVTGTVTWPDGHLAANASVYFSNFDSGFNGNGNGWSPGEGSNGSWDGTWYYQVNQLPADGSYSLPGCPCANLTAFLDLPSVDSADAANGGRGCIIIMQDDSGNFSGLQANPGDVINWHVLDMNCSPIFYASDPSSVQSERIATDPSQNGGDYTLYAGTWQAAEVRTSGG
jgi:hypothetical protein